MGRQLFSLDGHEDEVLDVTFDPRGQLLASASADGNAILWDVTMTTVNQFGDSKAKQLAKLTGHEGEISKVSCYA